MAQLFEDEKKDPDNRTRDNFVFLGYLSGTRVWFITGTAGQAGKPYRGITAD